MKQHFEQQNKLEQISRQAKLSMQELVSKSKSLSREETTLKVWKKQNNNKKCSDYCKK